jgi:hypothetical protein
MTPERDNRPEKTSSRDRRDEHEVPAQPPVREEYPGPQETSTGERSEPGTTKVRPDSVEERAGRRRGAS